MQGPISSCTSQQNHRRRTDLNHAVRVACQENVFDTTLVRRTPSVMKHHVVRVTKYDAGPDGTNRECRTRISHGMEKAPCLHHVNTNYTISRSNGKILP